MSVVSGSSSQTTVCTTSKMNWTDVVPFFESERFKQIVQKVNKDREQGYTVLPPRDLILRAFALTPPDNVKVVILGQDPYPTGEPLIHANGLAFSVNPDVSPLPKSLNNIFKELYDDLGIHRESGDLSDWAEQGVLLLNTSLTVRQGQPASHSQIGWQSLVRDVIEYLGTQRTGIVYLLWGRHAQKYKRMIDEQSNLIVQSPHPSPLSAHRGFFGSCPFSQTNKYLQQNNKQPITW